MNLKVITFIGAILLIIAVAAGVGFKLTQTSESQKGKVINNFTFEPHQTFGCAKYIAPEKMLTDTRTTSKNAKTPSVANTK